MSKQKHNYCEFCQKYLNYIQNYPSRNKIRESWKFEPPYCPSMKDNYNERNFMCDDIFECLLLNLDFSKKKYNSDYRDIWNVRCCNIDALI